MRAVVGEHHKSRGMRHRGLPQCRSTGRGLGNSLGIHAIVENDLAMRDGRNVGCRSEVGHLKMDLLEL